MQKSPLPTLDELPVPPFESELKKAQVKVYNKAPAAPVVEGTSVMPRQRPKGSSTTPLNLNTLPLTLSPSPTTSKKSQSPVAQPNFQSNVTYPSGFQSAATAAPDYQPSFFPPTNPEPANKQQLDSLFQSSIYPDPFRDDGAAESPTNAGAGDGANGNKQEGFAVQGAAAAAAVISPVSPENPLFGSGNLSQMGGQPTGMTESSNYVGATMTPPSTPTLAVPKGHRRNMSDTTAFNK